MHWQFCSEWGVFLAGVASHPQGVIRCCCCVWPRVQGVTVQLGSTSFVRHFFIFFSHTFTLQLLDMPWSQVSSLSAPGSCLQFLSRIMFRNPTARRRFHRMMLTHALALSASPIMHKIMSQRVYTSMHSAGLELTKQTYTRLEDNLIRHRGDRYSRTHETDLYQARG